MNTQSLENYLNSFASQVVKESKGILKSDKGNTALGDSIRAVVSTDANGYSVKFYMADYGTFLDKGVSGNKKKRSFLNYKGKNESSPYSYKAKQPPSGIIEKWIKRKGLKGRDKKGRFITHKSLSFLIARSIKKKGIPSLSFFQKPLGNAYKDLGKNILKEFKKDVQLYITTFTKTK
tara:strand:- start:6943 stop:7473 length:531 start_codon:yes stop_codon:yes gene_type:complete